MCAKLIDWRKIVTCILLNKVAVLHIEGDLKCLILCNVEA